MDIGTPGYRVPFDRVMKTLDRIMETRNRKKGAKEARGLAEAKIAALAVGWLEAGEKLTATKGDKLPANKAYTERQLALRDAAKEYRDRLKQED